MTIRGNTTIESIGCLEKFGNKLAEPPPSIFRYSEVKLKSARPYNLKWLYIQVEIQVPLSIKLKTELSTLREALRMLIKPAN